MTLTQINIDIDSLLQEATSAKDALEKAQQMKCTCTGFMLQYEGCNCEKAKQLKIAKQKAANFFAGF